VHTIFWLSFPAVLGKATGSSSHHTAAEGGRHFTAYDRAPRVPKATGGLTKQPQEVKAASPTTAEASSQKFTTAEAPLQKPRCIVVDDDDIVQEAITYTIRKTNMFDVHALGATFDDQLIMEDVIMGARSPLDKAELSPPHDPVEVVVIDWHLALPPPWPPHAQAQRPDGKAAIPADGIDLADRLRARGYVGKIILHTGESCSKVDEIQRTSSALDAVIEKGTPLNFRTDFLLATCS